MLFVVYVILGLFFFFVLRRAAVSVYRPATRLWHRPPIVGSVNKNVVFMCGLVKYDIIGAGALQNVIHVPYFLTLRVMIILPRWLQTLWHVQGED